MLVKAVKTVIKDLPDLGYKDSLPNFEALGTQAIEMVDAFVVSMEAKAKKFINDALDSIFAVTVKDIKETIPSMDEIKNKVKSLKNGEMRFLNDGKDYAAAARQAGRKVAKFAKEMIRAMREQGSNALAVAKEAGAEKMQEACVALQEGIANFDAAEAFEFVKSAYDTYQSFAAMTMEERKVKTKSFLQERVKEELVERYSEEVVARGELAAAAVLGDESAKTGNLNEETRNALVKLYGEDALKLGETMAKAATGDMDALADLDYQASAMLYKQARVQLVAKVGEEEMVRAEAALEAIQAQLDPEQKLSDASRVVLEEEYSETSVVMGLNIVKALSGDTDALRALQDQAFDLMTTVARETAVCVYGEDNVQLAEIVIMSTMAGDNTVAMEALKGGGEKDARTLWDQGIVQEYGSTTWAVAKVWVDYSQNGNQEMLTHFMAPREIDLDAIKNSLGVEMMNAAAILKTQALSISSSNGCVGDNQDEETVASSAEQPAATVGLLQLSEFVDRARLRMDARRRLRRARIEARITAQRSRINIRLQSVEVAGCQLEVPSLAEVGEALSSSARSFLSGDNGKPSELALKLLEHPLTKKIVSNPTVVLMLKLAVTTV